MLISSYTESLLIVSGINAIGAWGAGLALRSGQLSVAHAAFAGIAGYTSGYLTAHGHNFYLAAGVGIVVAAAVATALNAVTIRLNRLFFAFATLIFGEVAATIASGTQSLGGAVGLSGIPLDTSFAMVLICVVALVGADMFLLHGSRFELLSQLGAEDPGLVEQAGVSARRVRVLMFAISAGAAGLSGVLSAHYYGTVEPTDLQFVQSFDFVVFAVVGGVASPFGPVIGAVLLTLIPQWLSLGQAGQPLLYGVLVVAVLLVRPSGLISRRPIRPPRSYRSVESVNDRPSPSPIRLGEAESSV
jgi:branched-chain amino acid transport system permease protein